MLSHFAVEAKDFEYDESAKLGKGSYGEVYRGTYKRSAPEMPVAIKETATPQDWVASLRELSLLAEMRHRGTLRLIGFLIREGTGPTIITPLLPNGEVLDLVKKAKDGKAEPKWDATKKSMCVFGVAAAMAYLHSHGVLHRDLKLANVFLNEDFEPVIGDFGLARSYISGEMTMVVGTPYYMAPELWVDTYGEKYTGAIDVYAYAVFLYQLLSYADVMTLDDNTKRSIRSPQDWMRRVGKGARPVRPDAAVCSDFYWELITKCWDHTPDNRPSFIEILEGLQEHRESYAFPGCNIEELKAYEERVLEGVELVNRTDDCIDELREDCYDVLYFKETEPKQIPEYMTYTVNACKIDW